MFWFELCFNTCKVVKAVYSVVHVAQEQNL